MNSPILEDVLFAFEQDASLCDDKTLEEAFPIMMAVLKSLSLTRQGVNNVPHISELIEEKKAQFESVRCLRHSEKYTPPVIVVRN